MPVSVLTIFLSLLAGCAGSPVRIGMMDAEKLVQVETMDLCWAYSTHQYMGKIRPELMRRGVFTEREWSAIGRKRIFIGMSELAFNCSWPTTNNWEFRNYYRSKKGPWGVRVVYEYQDYVVGVPLSGELPKRVYVENGSIVAYQEGSDVSKAVCFFYWSRRCSDQFERN